MRLGFPPLIKWRPHFEFIRQRIGSNSSQATSQSMSSPNAPQLPRMPLRSWERTETPRLISTTRLIDSLKLGLSGSLDPA